MFGFHSLEYCNICRFYSGEYIVHTMLFTCGMLN